MCVNLEKTRKKKFINNIHFFKIYFHWTRSEKIELKKILIKFWTNFLKIIINFYEKRESITEIFLKNFEGIKKNFQETSCNI